MPVSHYPDWNSFEVGSRPADRPVAFCADLSPASVLGAYRHGLIPFPAADEYVRNFHEFRHEQDVADGVIAIVGSMDEDPYWTAWWSRGRTSPPAATSGSNCAAAVSGRRRTRPSGG